MLSIVADQNGKLTQQQQQQQPPPPPPRSSAVSAPLSSSLRLNTNEQSWAGHLTAIILVVNTFYIKPTLVLVYIAFSSRNISTISLL